MLNYVAAGFSNLGVSANAMTLSGFALGVASAFAIASGRFSLAAGLVTASGICDLLDGKIARLRGVDGKFGALFDSSLDRWSDALFYGAMAAYFWKAGEPVFMLLAFSAMAGAFQISYGRARSEGLGQNCQVGFWERGERTVFIVAALVTANPEWCVAVLGTATHLTAIRRLLYSRSRLAGSPAPEAPPRDRRSRQFLALTAGLLLSLLFVRF